MKLCPRCSELDPDEGPMDGEGLVRVTDSLVGKTVARRYRIIPRLGGGGMTRVCRSRSWSW